MYGNNIDILYKTNMMYYNYLDKVVNRLLQETKMVNGIIKKI